MSFETKYIPKDREAPRDRFQVEFNKEEREMFLEMQLYLRQAKDATAIKQWAFFGWLTISNNNDAMAYFREKLLINERNNKRLGMDIKTELQNKFHAKFEKIGWKIDL